jgi:hypothetical protein
MTGLENIVLQALLAFAPPPFTFSLLMMPLPTPKYGSS